MNFNKIISSINITNNNIDETQRQPKPCHEIITDPKKCILRNKLWRGDIIPLLPIQRNYCIIDDTQFDIERLKIDLSIAQEYVKWTDKDLHTHKWKAITMNSYKGTDQPMLNENSINSESKQHYIPTKTLDQCLYFKEILKNFNTDIFLVRLLKLDAGGIIKYHTDESIFKNRYDIIRCHIPIITDPKCKFQLGYPIQRPATGNDGIWNAGLLHSCYITPGYMWYTNVNALHGVHNDSTVDRVHLVIDMKPTHEMMRRIYGNKN